MQTDPLSATFSALADPTRRAILARLALGETTVSDLAEPFAMSLPAVSKHLKVLERAGLIARGREAQWRPCRIEVNALKPVDDWLENYRRGTGATAPRGFTIPHSEGDLRPGGKWRCCMRSPDGKELWLGGVYREIVENKFIVMTHAWDDDGGRPGPETLVTVKFEDLGAKTKVTLQQTGFDSIQSRDGHAGGWGECLDLLAEHLATMRA